MHPPSLASRVHPSLPPVEHVRERGWMRGVHVFVRRHPCFGERWHHDDHRVHSLAHPCLPHKLMSTHGCPHGDMICTSGTTVCGRVSPCYTGVKAIRLVVRSTEATLSRQTHWSKIPAGSGWAANDVRACWYCSSVVVACCRRVRLARRTARPSTPMSARNAVT